MLVILGQSSGGGGIALLIGFMIVLYFLPTIAVVARKGPNVGSVAVLNILLGWTLVGWVVSLAMAFADRSQPVQINVAGSTHHQITPAPVSPNSIDANASRSNF